MTGLRCCYRGCTHPAGFRYPRDPRFGDWLLCAEHVKPKWHPRDLTSIADQVVPVGEVQP